MFYFIMIIINNTIPSHIMRMYILPENSFFESKKHFFDMRSKKKFLKMDESFVDSKTFSLM